MSFRVCSSFDRSAPRASRAPRVTRGLAPAIALGLFAVTLASPVRAGRDEPGAAGLVAAVGMRCETRDDLREVAWRHYVLDRVTECAPRLHVPCPSAASRGAAPIGARGASGSATAGIGRTPEPGEVTNPDRDPVVVSSIERRVRWRDARRRLANPQYARTVDALRGAFTRERR